MAKRRTRQILLGRDRIAAEKTDIAEIGTGIVRHGSVVQRNSKEMPWNRIEKRRKRVAILCIGDELIGKGIALVCSVLEWKRWAANRKSIVLSGIRTAQPSNAVAMHCKETASGGKE